MSEKKPEHEERLLRQDRSGVRDPEQQSSQPAALDSQQISDGKKPTKKELDELALQVQLAATAVATSFLLIFIPNIETLSFMAFFVGFAFSPVFALKTIITMALTWEIFATVVFSFSGITFPFKVISWLLIGILGYSARRLHVKYFFEFLLFGVFAALVYDVIVTIPIALFFVSDEGAFISVLLSNVIIGLYFTLSHIIGNAVLFSFIPVVIHNVHRLLMRRYKHLVKISAEYFDYLDQFNTSQRLRWGISDITRKRKAVYAGILIIILALTTLAVVYQPDQPENDQVTELDIELIIDYQDLLETDQFQLVVLSNQSVLAILETVTDVEYTTEYGAPYITAINGIHENVNISGYSWTYYINNAYAGLGAANQYLQQHDVVEWRYQ